MSSIRCGHCKQMHGSVEAVRECYTHPERGWGFVKEASQAEIPDGRYAVEGKRGWACVHLVTEGEDQRVYQERAEGRLVPVRGAGVVHIRALIAADPDAALLAYLNQKS